MNKERHIEVAVIGGGAAGFFAAIHAADSAEVVIFEKTLKLLSKVKVSGGGRCNVTHDCEYPSQLVKYYPRGGRSLKKPFSEFNVSHTRDWFGKRGIKLKTEADGRVFPESDSSQTIIDCLMLEAEKRGVRIETKAEVTQIQKVDKGFRLDFKSAEIVYAKKVIVTVGGYSKEENYSWLSHLNLKIIPPVPSLFTFNVPDSDLSDLQGLSVSHGAVSVPGSNWKQEGPILITHWGFSAPAVITLSAWAALDLHTRKYRFPIHINWTGQNEEVVRARFQDMRSEHPAKVILSNPLFEIPRRLWERLARKTEITQSLTFGELPSKLMNQFIELLVRSPFEVGGKTTFKEEFVTAGGIDLSEVDLKTFESKKYPGLYFAGEVLNVDGVTGGYNFQHAWTSGYLAGKSAAKIQG